MLMLMLVLMLVLVLMLMLMLMLVVMLVVMVVVMVMVMVMVVVMVVPVGGRAAPGRTLQHRGFEDSLGGEAQNEQADRDGDQVSDDEPRRGHIHRQVLPVRALPPRKCAPGAHHNDGIDDGAESM